MKNIKVLLVPNWNLANGMKVEATVEAEYGTNVLKGSVATLAHHTGEYKAHPAPCNNKEVPVLASGTIVVSHLDLDTMGGVMALMGIKPAHDDFWSVAEYIDLNGPHNLNKVSLLSKEMIEAYWAWCSNGHYAQKVDVVTDVTDLVFLHAEAIARIIHGDISLIQRGREWAKEVKMKVEACLKYEDDFIRAFVTDNVFCSSSYYSELTNTMASVTVVYQTTEKKITIATCDGSISCVEVVQDLWGPEAGGHDGIAGSPRGKVKTEKDFYHAIEHIKSIVSSLAA